MKDQYEGHTRKGSHTLVVFGALSLVLYTVLFVKQELVNEYFTRGGLYAFLPIATAFIFSFVHGAFTGKFWTALGIEAKRKREVK